MAVSWPRRSSTAKLNFMTHVAHIERRSSLVWRASSQAIIGVDYLSVPRDYSVPLAAMLMVKRPQQQAVLRAKAEEWSHTKVVIGANVK